MTGPAGADRGVKRAYTRDRYGRTGDPAILGEGGGVSREEMAGRVELALYVAALIVIGGFLVAVVVGQCVQMGTEDRRWVLSVLGPVAVLTGLAVVGAVRSAGRAESLRR